MVFASASSHTRRRLQEALDEMDDIVKLLGTIQIGRRLLFKPILATNAEVSLLRSTISEAEVLAIPGRVYV
jgi:hypothetical protein